MNFVWIDKVKYNLVDHDKLKLPQQWTLRDGILVAYPNKAVPSKDQPQNRTHLYAELMK